MQDYFRDLVVSGATAGYSLTRFIPLTQNPSRLALVSTEFEGFSDPVNLLNLIENLKRITGISSMKYSNIGGRKRIDLQLGISVVDQ